MIMGAGATASGNFDTGLYDSQGNRLVSSGATAKGNAAAQILDVTDTRIGAGLYYLALAADGTNNYQMMSPGSLQLSKLVGAVQMASAYPLPATATFASLANIALPLLVALTSGL